MLRGRAGALTPTLEWRLTVPPSGSPGAAGISEQGAGLVCVSGPVRLSLAVGRRVADRCCVRWVELTPVTSALCYNKTLIMPTLLHASVIP